MSRKLDDVTLDVNAHEFEANNSTIEEKVLSTIQNALKLHSANFKCKDRPHQNKNGGMSRKARVELHKLNSKSNHNNPPERERERDRRRERERSSVHSYECDDG